MLPGGSRIETWMIEDMFPWSGLYYADPAQSLNTAGEELDDLDHDLYEVCNVLLLVPNAVGLREKEAEPRGEL